MSIIVQMPTSDGWWRTFAQPLPIKNKAWIEHVRRTTIMNGKNYIIDVSTLPKLGIAEKRAFQKWADAAFAGYEHYGLPMPLHMARLFVVIERYA